MANNLDRYSNTENMCTHQYCPDKTSTPLDELMSSTSWEWLTATVKLLGTWLWSTDEIEVYFIVFFVISKKLKNNQQIKDKQK